MLDELNIDYETYSDVDLKEVGAANYSRHPSTEVLMAAYSFNGGEEEQWIPAEGQEMPPELSEALIDREVQKWAWNAPFEMQITRNTLQMPVAVPQWRDTMVLGHYCSLPGKLSQAGAALGLAADKQKTAEGQRLIGLFSKRKKSQKKANKGEMIRTRWYQNLAKWEMFLEYNRQDVVAEKTILNKLRKHNLPQQEWELWFLDQQINEAGLPINMDMVRNASMLFAEAYAEGFMEMQDLTGLPNPMSTQQLLPWLKANGYMFNDCKKGHIKQAFGYFHKAPDHWSETDHFEYQMNSTLKEVLAIRLELSRTSIKKFDTLLRATGDDGLLRYVLQFMGAARTARWAGRTFQPQNLPRPEKRFEDGIELHAKHVEKLDLPSIQLLYGNVFDVLASTIRPAAQAPEGYLFIDADLNAIENRVLGWLADCEKILRVFKLGRDPYIDFGTYLFNRDYDDLWHEYKVLKNSGPRTISKPGVLGCLKGDTPVLTHQGWKALVELQPQDWLHDGDKWVRHEGVVFKGHQRVLCRSGLHATPDHRFLTVTGWKEHCQQVQQLQTFKSALVMGSGVSENDEVRPGQPDNSFYASVNVVENESYRDQTLCEDYPEVAPDVLRLTVAPMSGNGSGQSFSTYSQIVSTLRDRVAKTRKTVLTTITAHGEFLASSKLRNFGSRTCSMHSVQTGLWRSTGSTMTEITNRETSASQRDHSRTLIADTWDILNTGDYARFAVLTEDGCLVAHNCGYMLGAGKTYEDKQTGEIEATGLLGYAWNMGVKQFTMKDSSHSVAVFRREFKEVKDYWYAIERAAIKCVKTGQTTGCGVVSFDIYGDFLRMRLPSGRHLHYYKPLMQKTKMPWKNDDGSPAYKMSLTYMSQEKHQWKRVSTHPGKLTENADQAISRDLLAHGMVLADKRGLDMRLHVHDQIVGLVKEDRAEQDLAILMECMEDQPSWAKGLPLGSAGFTTKVFKKD